MASKKKKSRKNRDAASRPDGAAREPSNHNPERSSRRKRVGLYLVVILALIAGPLWVWNLSGRWILRGQEMLRVHRFKDAERFFTRARSVPLRSEQATLGLGRAAWMSGDIESAKSHLSDAAEQGVAEGLLRHEERLIEIRQGAAVELRPELPDMLRRTTNEEGPVILEAFAGGFLVRGRTDDAAEILAIWQDAIGDDPRLHFWRGIYFQAIGNPSDAIHAQRSALRLAPEMTVARLALAELYRESKYFGEAIPFYEAVLREQSKNPVPRLGLATCLIEIGKHDEGVRILRDYLSDFPNDDTARLVLAAHFQEFGTPAQVLEVLEPMDPTGKERIALEYMNSVAFHRLGDRDSFEKCFERFQRVNRSSTRAELWRRSYEQLPNDELAKRIAIAMAESDLQAAGPWIAKALSSHPDDVELKQLMTDYRRRSRSGDAGGASDSTGEQATDD